MKYLLANGADAVLARYSWSNVLLAFDFDGTLAPIVDHPDDARMRDGTRARLAIVAQRYPCVVISGRAHADVSARLAGIALAAVVGNHGLEPTAGMERYARVVASWLPMLRERLSTMKGVEIEDKGYSIAIHYRRSRQKRVATAAIWAAVARLHGTPRVIGGKQVVNLVPVGAPHKGMAVERLRSELGADTALYVGDDITDEDVFALDQPGRLLSVRIGRTGQTKAPYYLHDQADIDRLLDRLIALREHETSVRRDGP